MTATEARVTVVVVPRDHFSAAPRSLDNLLNRTDPPFRLVYVDGGSPPDIRRFLETKARAHDFTLVRTEEYLTPNQARNLGAAHASTEYVVFIDNDVLVVPGWLGSLVECADATGAWVVGPLYLIGELEHGAIHCAGGELHLAGEWGERSFRTVHRLQGQRLTDLDESPARGRCDFAEFHCMLVRADALAAAGPLDEQLLSSREHEDFCLGVAAKGGGVWFEPASIVTYLPGPRRPETTGVLGSPLRLSDVPFLSLRWSDAWNRRSTKHFAAKHGIARDHTPSIGVPNAQRQALFATLRSNTRRVAGSRVENALASVMYRAERVVNRMLYK